MKIKNFFILTTFAIFLFSCSKENVAPIDAETLVECHNEMNLGKSEMHDALQGEWNWEYVYYYWASSRSNGEDFIGLSVVFNSDSTLLFKMNGEITKNLNWSIHEYQSENFGVITDPVESSLEGIIVMCDDLVKFYASGGHGNDNYFRKIK